MKCTITKLLLSALMAIFLVPVVHAQILWGGLDDPNSTFEGGLNEWQTVGIHCSERINFEQVESYNAEWEWGISPKPQGYYLHHSTLPFASPTATNGAMIFDSNYKDAYDSPIYFGEGVCPAPHRGELISPIIDMTGHQGIALEFYQYYRRFGGPGSSQQVTASYIEVSADGGETWTSIQMNSSIQVNVATTNPSLGYLNVSQWADNNPNFRFKFVFDGDYYFWIVDDVSLIGVPPMNITGKRFMYSGTNVTQTQFGINRDTLQFAYEVENFGATVDLNLEVKVSNKETGEVLHRQTTELNVPERATKGKYFDELWIPQGVSVGEYVISYTATDALGREDLSPEDNTISFSFGVTEDNAINGSPNGGSILLSDVDGQWGYGANFVAPDIENDSNIDYVNLQNVSTHFSSFGSSTLDGKLATYYLLELGPNWYEYYGSILDDNEDAFKIVAEAEYPLSQEENGQIISIKMNDDNRSEEIKIEFGKNYFIIALVPDLVELAAMNGYPSYVLQYDEDNNPINTSNVYINSSRLYNGNAFSTNFATASSFWDIKFSVAFLSNTPKINKENYKVFPNPSADGYVNVELNFERNTETNIYVTDMSGKLFSHSKVNVMNEIHRIETNNLPAGTYIVTISNELGLGQEKVIVIR